MLPAFITRPALLAGLIAALALVPATARADQYAVDYCSNWDGTAGGVAFPTLTNPVVSSAEVPKAGVPTAFANDCGIVGGGLHLQLPVQTMPADTFARVAVAIPADRPNIQMERVQTIYSAPAWGGGPVFLTIYAFPDGTRTEVANTQPPTTATTDRPLPARTRLLTWNVFCSAADCTIAEQNVLNIGRTRLFLNESVAPTLTITGGTLSAPGPKSGRMSLAFDAADTDSGVASVSATLGGTEIGSLGLACTFKDWSACPREAKDQLLQVDTAKVANGAHELVVTARDTANNAVTRSLGSVTVANAAAGAPGAVAVPNGVPASRLAKLTANFTTTRARSRRLRFTARPTVRGRLVDEAGNPIAGATVALLQRQRRVGARTTQFATVRTAADGTFRQTVESGPSRTITLAYTAFSTDAKPAATAVLRTTVRASVTARVSPRSVPAGGRITLTGRLRFLPRSGVEVKIQASNAGRWQTVDDVRTRSNGTFRWRYRFRSSNRGRTYAFRVRVVSPIYPFAAGNSKVIRVRVR